MIIGGVLGPITRHPYTDKWGDPTWERQYIYGMMRRQLSLLEVPDDSRLNAYTDQVRRNNAFDANGPVPGPNQGVTAAARSAVPDQACHLRHQGEPCLRPGPG